LSTREASFPAESVALPWSTRLRLLSASLFSAKRPLFALFQSVGIQVLITAINIATGVVTARLLGPEGRGEYAAVTLWPPLLATLAVAGLNSAVVFRMRRHPEAVDRIAGSALLVGGVSAVLMISLGLVLLPMFMSHYDPATVLFAQICLVSVFVNSTQNVIKQTFAGLAQFGRCNLTHLLPQLFHLIALLVLIPLSMMSARAAATALFVSGFVAVLVMLPSFIRAARPRLTRSFAELRQLLSYSSRAALMDVVFALATHADRLVLVPLLPASQLGFYAVAFSFSRIIQFVQPAILSVMLSHLSGQSEEGGKRVHDHACRFLLAALVLGCAVLWVAGEWLLVFTYGDEFGAAALVFRLLVIEASLGALSQITVQLFLSRDRPGVVSTIQVIVLVLSVAALLVLVPRYGLVGAAIGLLGAASVRWLLLLGAMRWVLGLPLPRLYPGRDDLIYLRGRLR